MAPHSRTYTTSAPPAASVSRVPEGRGLKGNGLEPEEMVSPAERGHPRWEHGRLSWCLSFWSLHRLFPPPSCLLISASVALTPHLPLASSFLFKFSGASPELNPGLHPKEPLISPPPLNSIGSPWSLLLAAVHFGKPNLACPVTFHVSVISRSCQVIGPGKDKSCSLTGQAGKRNFVKMSIRHFPLGHGPGHAFKF